MAYNYGAPQGYGQSRPNGGPWAPQAQYQGQATYNAPLNRPGNDGRRDGFNDYGRYDNRGGRSGLGADNGGGRNVERDRQQVRDNMIASQPPTREEIARTIFVGGLGDEAPPDTAIEAILQCAGKLRRWMRPKDAKGERCRFGFAEYEDVDSLEAANTLFSEGIEAPLYKDGKIVSAEEGPKMQKLLVMIDKQSIEYIEEWTSKRREGDEAKQQFRLDGAREDLRQCMASLLNGNAFNMNSFEANGDIVMFDDMNGGQSGEQPEGSLEDELADIPPEQRLVVAQEIKAFRERALRRDQKPLPERSETSINRLASPGPNGSKAVSGAPSGPKGYRGAQLPSDYVNGVAFVSANSLPAEDDSDASDNELETRRNAAKEQEQERAFLDAERRWLNRERQRASAVDRERTREEAESRVLEQRKEEAARQMAKWDDEEEDRIGRHDYYRDRSMWSRRRAAARAAEARDDDMDRQRELREMEDERARHAMGDRLLDEVTADLAAKAIRPAQSESANGTFKLSLGGTLRKSTVAPKRTIADVAGLLEEDEDSANAALQQGPRAITASDLHTATNAGTDMSEEERVAARQALAGEIPMDAASLFAWEVRWSYISDDVLEREIKPFVEKKIVDIIGVQEEFLVDLIMTGLKEQKPAKDLIADLEQVLDEEAEGLVRKIWRLVVYFGEAEGRGLVN